MSMSNSQIKSYQFNRLKKLIIHAYETVRYYQELFDNNNLKPTDIQCLEDYKKLPILDKKTLNTHFNQLISNKKFKLD